MNNLLKSEEKAVKCGEQRCHQYITYMYVCLLSPFLFVCRVCMCTRVWVHSPCVWLWIPECDSRSFPLYSSTLFLEVRSLTEPGFALLAILASQGDPRIQVSISTEIISMLSLIQVSMWVYVLQNLNSGPHACATSTLPTKPSPQPQA